MRSARLLFLMTACLCLVAFLAACGGHAKTAARTATVVPVTPTPTPVIYTYYEVQFGDTLGVIAERFKVRESVVVSLNHLKNANEIYVGQRLRLPPGSVASTPVPVPIENVRVPILMYHHIALLNANAGNEWYVTTVTPAAFEEQMAYLAYNGYHTVAISDLVAAFQGGRKLPENPVVITFDDGWDECYDAAFPVLQKYHLKATFFIIVSSVGAGATMTWDQIEALSNAGMEIGSHSMTHPYLTQLGADTLTWELRNSKAVLEQHIAGSVEALAYPFGAYDSNVIVQAQTAGYRAAVTIQDGLFNTSDSFFEMPRFTVPYGGTLSQFVSFLGE